MTPLILLRTPQSPLSQDPYHQYLSRPESNYSPHHLPVLTTRFLTENVEEELRKCKGKEKAVDNEEGGEYDGVIITSGRSVEALSLVFSQSKATSSGTRRLEGIKYFVVGTSTSSALLNLSSSSKSRIQINPGDILGAEESGTGEKLAQFILEYFKSSSPSTARKLLYLVGDKNSSTIDEILSGGDISTRRLQVYSTTVIPSFQDDLKHLLSSLSSSLPSPSSNSNSNEDSPSIWIATFSPSVSSPLFSSLRSLGYLPSLSSSSPSPPPKGNIQIAAIGPTTASYIKEKEGYDCDAVAGRPEVEELVKAIDEARRREREMKGL